MTMRFLILLCLLFALPGEAQQADGPLLMDREKAKPEKVKGPRGTLDFQGDYFEEEDQGRLSVKYLVQGGGAEKADLQQDDVVVAFNGVGFRFRDDLERVEHFDGLMPGDQVDVQILRDGEPLTLEITASEASLEQLQLLEEFRAEAKYRRQYKTLRQLGRGEGVVIEVHRDPTKDRLAYSVPGFPPQTLQHMQVYADTFPPLRDALAKIPPDGRVWLDVKLTGIRLNVRLLEEKPGNDTGGH